MSYFVNKTDGTAIIVLDGTKDSTSTSLTLVGRLATNYGEVQNENFLHLLENFAFSSSPAFPITGQLWYDTSTKNLKSYNFTDQAWTTVGSEIVGNVDLTGNLFVGPNNFQLQDLNGNFSFTNTINNGNIVFYSNTGGTNTTSLIIDGNSGKLIVNGNATNNFGLTTKIYVDSLISQTGDYSNVALAANVSIINSNLAVRVNTEANLSSRIDAANIQINLRDTIARVNSINSAIDTALQANVISINNSLAAANIEIGSLRANITAANISHTANSTATNAAIVTANVGMKAYVDSKVSSIDLTPYATKASPALTGTPTAPTAAFGDNSTKLATTEYVITRAQYWDGSRKFVSTLNPTSSDGSNGDLWFKYS